MKVTLSDRNIKSQNMGRSSSRHIVCCPADSLHIVNISIYLFVLDGR